MIYIYIYIYISDVNICALCEEPVTDIWHTLWTCPKLHHSEDECIIDSNYLKDELCMNKVHFYNLALVVEDDLIPDERYDPFDDYFLNKAKYNEDVIEMALGVKYSKHPTISRCGVGCTLCENI